MSARTMATINKTIMKLNVIPSDAMIDLNSIMFRFIDDSVLSGQKITSWQEVADAVQIARFEMDRFFRTKLPRLSGIQYC